MTSGASTIRPESQKLRFSCHPFFRLAGNAILGPPATCPQAVRWAVVFFDDFALLVLLQVVLIYFGPAEPKAVVALWSSN